MKAKKIFLLGILTAALLVVCGCGKKTTPLPGPNINPNVMTNPTTPDTGQPSGTAGNVATPSNVAPEEDVDNIETDLNSINDSDFSGTDLNDKDLEW